MGLSPPLRPERDTKSLARIAITSPKSHDSPVADSILRTFSNGRTTVQTIPNSDNDKLLKRVTRPWREIAQTTFYTKRN